VADAWLLDTGFLIAVVDVSDPHHRVCTDALQIIKGPLLTVEGVLAEATHLLRRVPQGPRHAVEFALGAAAVFFEPSATSLRRALELMDKYRDVPMDWVDALLVVAAEESGITRVLTLDRRGFNTYRAKRTKPFTVLPASK